MGQLIYSAIMSLDGYVADAGGRFDWAAPDEELHTFINDLERKVHTYLYGRGMYETMVAWETVGPRNVQPPYLLDFAEIWRAADKIVYSRTLDKVSSVRTKLERNFDVEAVRRLKAETGRDILIGGPGLAGQAIRSGLVDEYHLFIMPVIVGGGKRALPDGAFRQLELLDERRFGIGAVYTRYRAKT